MAATAKTTMNSGSDGDRTTERVVIEQRLLKIDEAFIYRIPPMRSADGHRAEDWNLAKPLATCSLVVSRRDNDLCINVMGERPKPGAPAGATENFLFAQSRVQVDFSNPSHKIDYWVNPVVDSSRYFAVRIKDSKTGREAFIGVGFRERSDATNFRMSIEDYHNSMKREEKAAVLQKEFEQTLSLQGKARGEEAGEAKSETMLPPNSSLSLKEGEKMHINIKGARASKQSPRTKKGIVGAKGLKKPPPAPGVIPTLDEFGNQGSATDYPNNTTSESDVDWGDFEG